MLMHGSKNGSKTGDKEKKQMLTLKAVSKEMNKVHKDYCVSKVGQWCLLNFLSKCIIHDDDANIPVSPTVC